LLRRPELSEAGRAALRQVFPDAPPAMLSAAVFHVFTDGVAAAAAWLAAVERFLRDPSLGLDGGATYHLLYHLYNWQQFQALLPAGKQGVLELLGDTKLFLSEGDPESAGRALRQLEEMFQAGLQPPEIQ
jgi:hypothetical protein